MLQIITPHKAKYGINVFAICQRLRPRWGFAYLAIIGCQRICSAVSDSFKFVLMVLPFVLGMKCLIPTTRWLLENPNLRRTERAQSTIGDKYIGTIRFVD